MQCVNNLKQLGLAIHNYNDVNDALPPTGNASTPNDFSMKARLLPFLEQAALFNAMNMSFNHNDTTTVGAYTNWTARTTVVNVFLCPSDGNIPIGTNTIPNGATRQVGYTSYPNNVGTFYFNNGNRFDGPAYRLAATNPSVLTLAAVRDSTANTAIWSEWVRGRDKYVGPGLDQVYVVPQASGTAVPLDTLADSCQAATNYYVSGTAGGSATTAWDQKGADWMSNNCGEGGCYSHVTLPNKKGCVFSNDTSVHTYYTVIGASSNHSGGVNVGFLDGSVKFVKASVSPPTWRALATFAGGEVLGGDSY